MGDGSLSTKCWKTLCPAFNLVTRVKEPLSYDWHSLATLFVQRLEVSFSQPTQLRVGRDCSSFYSLLERESKVREGRCVLQIQYHTYSKASNFSDRDIAICPNQISNLSQMMHGDQWLVVPFVKLKMPGVPSQWNSCPSWFRERVCDMK